MTPGSRSPARRWSLARFIRERSDAILADWRAFAASLAHDGPDLDAAQLQDHGPHLLENIAWSLRPGPGPADAPPHPEATVLHADARRLQGFTVDAVVAEYRALRASVLAHWRREGGGTDARDTADLSRFDEAIEEGIADAISRYVQQTRLATDLFIGILGHDIRNPLGTIMACAEYLVKSRQLPGSAAAPILNAAARIQSIVEHTADFSRAQSHGALPVRPQPCNLGELLAKVVQETQVRHPQRSLLCDVSGQLDGQWDEQRLAQVASNLLGNAIAYGSRDGCITVQAWSMAGQACFSVHNWGTAIPATEQQHIFQPLVRGHSALNERRARSGLGLGLYICREIVRAHGGSISVSSTPAAGTRFTVHLPHCRDPA